MCVLIDDIYFCRYSHPYENTMKMAERYSIPDNPLAAIISSLLLDLGIITSSNSDRIIDRNAVRRQRNRCRSENIPERVNMKSIYFDGKID